jgi:hypothetical protein
MAMDESDLIAFIEHEEANCISAYTGALAEQRRKAMQYYYGQPYGNEVEGKSQVVTTEVKDAVEGILPALMAIFAASGEIVRCEPKKPGDEQLAAQATDYLHYVFWEKNPGFLVLYCLFKDALLLKNGYTKVYWEEYADQKTETYEDLNGPELAMLLQDPELEPLKIEQDSDAAEEGELDPTGTYDAKFRRTVSLGKTCIDPVPPEEVLISRDTPNELTKARFVEHRTLKTISEIRKMGFDVPDDISDFAPNADFNLERIERNKFDDALAYRVDQANADPTTRRVWLCEAYFYVDYDGDGIAEYRKVTKIGRTILDNEEFDSTPIIGGTAIIMPHKHYGLSIFDLIGDIQLLKSTITRQLLDNAYVANNGRMAVLDGMVNMDDLLTSRPNGVIRQKVIGAVTPIPPTLLGNNFYSLLEYFDKIKQNRVGATDFPNAVDPDAINAKAAFVDAFKNAAMERINLMARILAETVVKPLFWKILELECKHQNKQEMVQLRGNWVPINPREWRNRFNISVTVGLGTGSQQTTLQGAMGIMQIQDGISKMGLSGRVVTEQNIYQAARKYAQAVFPKNADAFFQDPAGLPPPQPQPNPDMLKIQLAWAKAQMGDKQKRDKAMQDFAIEMKRMGIDLTAIGADMHMHDKEQEAEAAKHVATAQNDHREAMLDRALQVALASIDARAAQAQLKNEESKPAKVEEQKPEKKDPIPVIHIHMPAGKKKISKAEDGSYVAEEIQD